MDSHLTHVCTSLQVSMEHGYRTCGRGESQEIVVATSLWSYCGSYVCMMAAIDVSPSTRLGSHSYSRSSAAAAAQEARMIIERVEEQKYYDNRRDMPGRADVCVKLEYVFVPLVVKSDRRSGGMVNGATSK